ncbi:MAG: glycosyltransferase 87 family protein [Actinomycetota bacterium]|nr:glycosyltransferase 87 family protein [Actinomycetota bacterium]
MAAVGLLTSSAAATALLVLTVEHPRPASFLPLVFVAFGGLLTVALVPALRAAITFAVVAVLTAAVLIVAVVPQPPLGADLWVYAIYGRTIVDHGESPYVHPPGDFPDDPWVDELWLYRDARNFYGPVFIAKAAAIAAIGGDSRLVVRLLYQVGAAVAVMASLVLLVRAGAPVAAAALFSLNPVVIVEVVSQGRMDAEIGLALLVGALCASRRHPHVAAVAIAAAALVKLPAALALVALVAWTYRRDGARRAGTVTAVSVGAIVLGYLAAGGADALRPLIDVRTATNDVNIWVLVRENGLARFFGDVNVELGALGPITTIASVATLALSALLVLSRWDDDDPTLVLALPVLAYMLTSTYPSSWYVGWILPLLALRCRSNAARVALALSALLFIRQTYFAAAYIEQNLAAGEGVVAPLQDDLLSALYPAAITLEVVAIVVLVVDAVRRRSGQDRDRPPRQQGVAGRAHRRSLPSTAEVSTT